jgi:AcrR family transcriptional regulator
MARPPARSRDAYRTAILEAAESVMMEVGPTNTKMAAIAQRAGISYGALYRHFQDREDLLLAVMLQHSRTVEQSWLRSAEDDDPLDRIVALTTRPIVELDENPRVREILSSVQSAEQMIYGAEEEVARLNAVAVSLMRTAVDEAKELGYFAGLDTDAVVMTCVGVSINYILHNTLPAPESWSAVAREVGKVVRALAGPPARSRTRTARRR